LLEVDAASRVTVLPNSSVLKVTFCDTSRVIILCMAHDAFQTFGELLAHLRKRAHLTQAELARAVGYSREQIVRLEKNQRVPDRAVVAAVFIPALDLDDEPKLAQHLRDLASSACQPRSNLPAQLTSFIGREAEVSAVCGYLLDPGKRLITLIGPPGIGKTRLSLQVAHEVLHDFADGVFFVPLAAITDPDFVAQAITQSLGLVESDQRSAQERLVEGIGARQMLLVLDNFEQIVDAAPLTDELLRVCPHLKIMVTSRESLRVPGEWLYPVPTLSIPAEAQVKTLTEQAADQFSALRLFEERARAVRPDFALTPDNLAVVSSICRQLDGLPLAIELIASRIRLMSPQALAAHLTSDFKLHADGMRGVPARQKTLHNAIAWSYDRLSQAEQMLLARLSVLAGGFTLEAAQAITQLPHATNSVMSLLDKSLLIRTIDAQGETRFGQLEMIRDFALNRLRERNDEAKLRDRHLAYFLDLAEQADRAIHGPQQLTWLDRLELEQDNYRAVFEWCLVMPRPRIDLAEQPREVEQYIETGLRLAQALNSYWTLRGHLSEGRSWIAELLERSDEVPAGVRARALVQAGALANLQGDYKQAKASTETGLTLCRELNDKSGAALALLNLSSLVFERGDYTSSCELRLESQRLYREVGDRAGVAEALLELAYAVVAISDYPRAATLFAENLAMWRELGDKRGIAWALNGLGDIAFLQNDHNRASLLFQESLINAQELRYREGVVASLYRLGEVARFSGHYAQAEVLFTECLKLAQEYGARGTTSMILCTLAYSVEHQGRLTQAASLFAESLTLARELGAQHDIALGLAGLASAADLLNQPQRAVTLLSAAQSLFDTFSAAYLNPAERLEIERTTTSLKSQLAETAFAKAWAEGQALTVEQAIDLALQASPLLAVKS
jgi:predicted ATPase/transcriptional regulator with XRE-family HTH domain